MSVFILSLLTVWSSCHESLDLSLCTNYAQSRDDGFSSHQFIFLFCASSVHTT